MNTKVTAALVSLAALAVVGVFYGGDRPGPAQIESAKVAVPAPSLERPQPEAPRLGLGSTGAGRVAEPDQRVTAPQTSVEPGPTATEHVVRGRVLNIDGSPLAGLSIRLQGASEEPVASGPGGWFELTTTAASVRLETPDERYVNVREGVFNAFNEVVPIVVVAPVLELAGRVVDQTGWELGGVHLRLELPADLDARLGCDLESSRELRWTTSSDGEGRFAFARLPAVEGALLTAVLDGYEASRSPAPSSTDLHHEVVLARPAVTAAGVLVGRVLDPEGARAPGARVALGLASVLADEEGEFRIDLERAVTAQTLRAIQPGFLPAVLERPFEEDPSASGAEAKGWPEFVELRLPGRALAIAGRVIDSEGAPVENVRVWLASPTPFGVVGMMPVSAESLSGGAKVPPEALEFASNGPAEDGDNNWNYHLAGGPSNAFWHWLRTDAEGRFQFDGLSARDYRLKVMDDVSLRTHETEPIRAGRTNVDVRLPAPAVWSELSGRVVTDAGTPLEGVRVRLGCEAYTQRARIFGGRSEIGMLALREEFVTDSSGRFEFRDVPRQAVYLSLESSEIVPTRFDLTGADDGLNLRVPVEARCRAELFVERTPGAYNLSAFDARGERLELLTISASSVTAGTFLRIVGGTTGMFSVSIRATTFVLTDADGIELGRIPVQLVPGKLNRILD